MLEGDDGSDGQAGPNWVWILILAAAACALIAYVVYMALGMPGMDHGGSGTSGSMLH